MRIAVLGAGQIGRHHCRVVSEHPDAELAIVVDPEPATEGLAYAARAAWLPSLDHFLSGRPHDVSAAIVAVPTAAHASVVIRLLEAGIPVLVEKPIAHNLRDALAMISVARKKRLLLSVGHVERFNPAVQALQERISANELGRIFQVHARRLSPFPSRIGDSGVALDLATHDLDVMCQVAGRPRRVFAEVERRAHRTHEDLLVATLRFESGIIGLLEVNWLTPTKVRQMTVTGERGMFVVDYLNQHLTLYENARATTDWEALDLFDGVTEGNVTRYAIPRKEPLRAQLDAFVRALHGEDKVLVTPEQALEVLRLALLAVQSGTLGQVINPGSPADSTV